MISPRTAIASASLATAALAAVVVSAGAASPVGACKASRLSGTFVEIPGSGAAGHVGYRLTLKNRSTRNCYVKGLPKVRLLDRHGHSLPSHVVSAGGRSRRVVIRPTHTAIADARISDVTGRGDRQSGRCQPAAFRARVSPRPGGGKLVVAVAPHTSVCEKGRMAFHPFIGGS